MEDEEIVNNNSVKRKGWSEEKVAYDVLLNALIIDIRRTSGELLADVCIGLNAGKLLILSNFSLFFVGT